MKENRFKYRPVLLSIYLWFLSGVALLSIVSLVHADIPTPRGCLGFEVGTPRKVADANEIVNYFWKLDDASDRIVVREIGKTTMGNPFLVAFITSEENHKNLDTYRAYQQMLADPRKINDDRAEEIIRDGKTIVMINCSIHATEIGAAQMSMKLAYDLATKDDIDTQKILENVILLLIPMHNPDGIQMVVDWYEKYLGTQYEGGRMPWLYHKYVGHDNNRDWYMFTQKETQLTIQVHNTWHPQIIVDMHQMGNRGARLFVPPYVDPYEPNVDPILRQLVAQMGSFIATELTAEGKAGVMHSERFDAWTPARAYHHYHGGIRILTEAASARIATPISQKPEDLSEYVRKPSVKMPLPWQGGEWSLKDIVEYDYAAAKAALIQAASLRRNWLRNFYRIHKKAVNRTEPPFAFVIPHHQKDLSTAVKMLNILRMGGVEIHQAEAPFQAGEQRFSKGTYLVYTAQPYGGFAKALLENQEYPEIRETPNGPLKTPYDVVAHTLPLLMGIETVEIEQPFEAKTVLLDNLSSPKGSVATKNGAVGYVWDYRSNDDIVALNRLLKKGYEAFWVSESFKANGKVYAVGSIIVKQKPGLMDDLYLITDDLWVHFEGLTATPDIDTYALKTPRLGLYKSWTASMDEGWTRWVLEQYEFPYTSIYDKDIRTGNLNNKIDVLVIPDMRTRSIVEGMPEDYMPPEYAGGIGEEGIKSIKQFVENGGTLITLNGSSAFPINHFSLDVENRVETMNRRLFFIPGSILKASVDNRHPIAYGFEDETAVFYRRSPAFTARSGKSVVHYPMENPLLSGWVNGENYLFNKSALVDIPHGKGKIILIGFPAQYRAQSHGTFKFLFNAILYGPAQRTKWHHE